ncbi:MAG: nucleotidyltransferase family protein [Anaerolineae bacterium]|nr:nucleotidyltransferase family protein [Anaerolineae bacterium]
MNPSNVQTAVPIPYDALRGFCERHHIVRLWLFGSVLRDDFRADSDIDVLVQFDPNAVPGWEFYGAWTSELEAILGHPVDLGTPDSLRSWIKPHVMANAQVVYERPE